MRITFWPQSLFGRLIAASVLAVLAAELFAFMLIAREREYFVLQGNVREWSRRMAEITFMLQPLSASERELAATRLMEQPRRLARVPAGGGLPLNDAWMRHTQRFFSSQYIFIRVPLSPDFESTLKRQLQTTLGSAYQLSIMPTADAASKAIPIPTPLFEPHEGSGVQLYDIKVGFPSGGSVLFRIGHLPRGARLPRNLFVNLALLVVVLVIALYVTARSITRPLSNLVRAAEGLGRNVRQPKLAEKGARELRDAAHAFNTMQDRLHRYLDSRTRVLAAMSHDLKTPLTRLRLQVETALDDPAIQARFSKELDEMEGMVRGALALFRGLDDDEVLAPIDINALMATLRSEFAEMGADVTIEGKAAQPFTGKPQALKRCLTNLIANAVKFGVRATIVIEEGVALIIRVRDDGPGIPPEELERVFEPFYRVESSRNRDTGGTGLGLSIARDVAQAHGGSLTARNLAAGGLEALLVLPRSA